MSNAQTDIDNRRVLADPQRIVPGERSVIYEWEITNDDKGHRRLAVLIVQYRKKGVNYATYERHPNSFVSWLRTEEEDTTELCPMRTYEGLSGIQITTEEVTRFSQKRLRAFADAALQRVRHLYTEQGGVLAPYFPTVAEREDHKGSAQ
jgi:hypothetical protein